jgi:hypothetical protein
MNFEANKKKILESLRREKSRKKISPSRSALKPSGADLAGVASQDTLKVPVTDV